MKRSTSDAEDYYPAAHALVVYVQYTALSYDPASPDRLHEPHWDRRGAVLAGYLTAIVNVNRLNHYMRQRTGAWVAQALATFRAEFTRSTILSITVNWFTRTVPAPLSRLHAAEEALGYYWTLPAGDWWSINAHVRRVNAACPRGHQCCMVLTADWRVPCHHAHRCCLERYPDIIRYHVLPHYDFCDCEPQ